MCENNLTTEKAKRDYKLVCAALKEKDEKAYAELLKFYEGPIRRMFRNKTNSEDECDDLVMETFTKAFLQLHLYQPTNAFSTWLFTIANNTFIDCKRRQRLDFTSIDTLASSTDGDVREIQVPSSGPTPEEELIEAQRLKQLRDVVAQLKPRYRSVMEMRVFEDLSYEEIAERLQLPMGTVKVHLLRAKQMLAAIIKNQQESL